MIEKSVTHFHNLFLSVTWISCLWKTFQEWEKFSCLCCLHAIVWIQVVLESSTFCNVRKGDEHLSTLRYASFFYFKSFCSCSSWFIPRYSLSCAVVQPPTVVSLAATGKSTARVTWSSVNKVLLYQVKVSDSDTSNPPVIRNTSSTSMDISNLEPCSNYTVGVSSVNVFLVPGEPTNVYHSTSSKSFIGGGFCLFIRSSHSTV